MHRFFASFILLLALLGLSAAGRAETLLDIYRLAMESDPQLRAAEAARNAALEAGPQARALLLPNVGFSTEVTRTRIDDRTAANSDITYNDKRYSLALSQPLFNKERWVQLQQADAAIARAEAEYAAAAQALIVRVAERYFAVLDALDNLEFARAERDAIARQLEQAKQRFEVGLIAITDVHEAQARYDLAVAQEIAAQNQLDSSREALSELTGQPPEHLAGLDRDLPLIKPEPEDMEQWVATALEQNLSLLASRHAVEVARREMERRHAGHYPTLDLVARHSFTDVNFGGLFPLERFDSSIGVQLNLPLYAGGGISSRTREALHLLDQARENLERARRETVRLTRDAFRGVIARISQVKALQQALVSAQAALKATEAGFEVGTRTIVDVLNAQRELYRAQRDFASARYDYLLNTLRLKQAAGILSVSDLQQIGRWFQ